MVKVKKDLTGERFGRLIVLGQSENDYISPKGQHHSMWWCICDCGSDKIEVRGSELTNGHTKSCGCYHKEVVAEIGRSNKTENRYEKKDTYYVGYTDKNEPFYFDEGDFELIRKYKWHIRSDGYVESFSEGRKKTLMHRLVTGTESQDNYFVDHILGAETKNDNRKYNLRIVTKSQNNMNQQIRKDNTSGVKGVSWNKREEKWHAYITANKKRFDLGFYDCLEKAMQVRKAAEDILHGDFSYHNSQLIGNERLQMFEKLYGSNSDIDTENVS